MFRLHVEALWDPGLFGCSPYETWREGKELELSTGQVTLTTLQTAEKEEKERGEWEGIVLRVVCENFYKLINK